MPRFIILGFFALSLALISPCSAFQISDGGAAQNGAATMQKGKSAKRAPASSSQAPRQSEVPGRQQVVNVFVDRIEGGVIYSRDGQQYEIGYAKVIDNTGSHPKARTKAAELFFENGSVVGVVLK